MTKSAILNAEANTLIHMNEQDTFDRLFREYHAALCFYAQRITASAEDAEDVVEEVFMQCWHNGQVFDSEDHARFFLYRSVKNASLNHLKIAQRAAQKHNLANQGYDDTEESHQDRLIRAEVMREIYRQIDSLAPQERKVLLLSLRGHKKLQEIANELGLSLQTVKNCKARALNRLRIKLSPGDFLLLILIGTLYK